MTNPPEDETLEILSQAFAAESRSATRNRAFAALAQKEGRTGAAALFKAAALSGETRARRLLNLMRGKIGSTDQNLIEAFGQAAPDLYPGLIASAGQVSKVAAGALEQNRGIEQTLKSLFTPELEKHQAAEYQVCRICGHVAVGPAPERCPVCKAVKEKFKAAD